MASAPVFVGTPTTGVVHATAANTGKDGGGTVYTVISGGSSGTAVYGIRIKSQVTTTPGTYRLFVKRSGAFYLFYEGLMTAITSSGTVATFIDDLRSTDGSPIVFLKNGDDLVACINNGEATDFIAYWAGDY